MENLSLPPPGIQYKKSPLSSSGYPYSVGTTPSGNPSIYNEDELKKGKELTVVVQRIPDQPLSSSSSFSTVSHSSSVIHDANSSSLFSSSSSSPTVSFSSSSPFSFQIVILRYLALFGVLLIVIGLILYFTKDKETDSIPGFMLMLFGFLLFNGFWCWYRRVQSLERERTEVTMEEEAADDEEDEYTTTTNSRSTRVRYDRSMIVVNNPHFNTTRINLPPPPSSSSSSSSSIPNVSL